MSATITGVGSGFDIDSWVSQLVSAKENSILAPLETKLSTLESKNSAVNALKTKYSTLQSALQTFTKTIYNSSSDMWSNTLINSSNSAYATATSTGAVNAKNVNLKIQQIATSTVAKSVNSLGVVNSTNVQSAKYVNLANGQAEAGTFSIFLNDKEYAIEVEENDTIQNILDRIKSITGNLVQGSVDNEGNLSLTAYKQRSGNLGYGDQRYVVDETASLVLGSSGDTSNFASALKMHDKTMNTDGTGAYIYKSTYPISLVNTDKSITSAESGLDGVEFKGDWGQSTDSGTITINGVDFEIDDKTTINNLISRINGNSEANVNASYDSLTNKFILTSTQTGENNISLSEKNTNFLQVLGLMESNGYNSEKIAEGSQTLGQNAIAYINGNKVISTSNTITGESSGISNLSITIKKPTSEYSGNSEDDREINLDIERDHTKVKEALNSFVTAYNDVITTTKSYGSSTGAIGNDSSLNSILNQVRQITTTLSDDNGGMYSMLSQIGISTSSADITKLSIDEKKLDEALSKNLDSVKTLLSDGLTSEANNGLFDTLLSNVTNILNTENGYFANKTNSLNDQIKNMNNRIERANTRLVNYESRLLLQFNRMDQTISSLNSQLTTFTSYFS